MLHATYQQKYKHAVNNEVIRRLLVRYFMDKGFKDSFDKLVYPSLIQDMPYIIPILSNKVEITPHVVELDPVIGKAILGWNLFVLGYYRMYLGETYHNDLMGLARQIRTGFIIPNGQATRQSSPKRIIAFILRVLGSHSDGYVDLLPPTRSPQKPGDMLASRGSVVGSPHQFFGRPYSI